MSTTPYEALQQGALNAFVQMADHMVNVAPPPRP